MNRTMLIDATHPEETRVVVTEKNKILEFDVESSRRQQTIGNIYLAKVTRVEPSLQAAFVDYGAGKQGFLPFSEIHPDYYQIPIEDRQRLLESERARFRDEDDDSHEADLAQDGVLEERNDDESATDINEADGDEASELDEDQDRSAVAPRAEKTRKPESAFSQRVSRRSYKIQEVIKKRQILLVQVVKEERGNKGAALTSYLSLAGRYCVLMPNTARGGGISRKITKVEDRKRLKEITNSMEIPEGMGLIVRTAGAARAKPELQRDFEYLLRLWDNIRELTLSSVAPCTVHEEGNLIKRALRDIYGKDTGDIFVEGESAFREAKDFMKMISPQSVKSVRLYDEKVPLFVKHYAEKQLEELTGPIVQLRSGGYLVIGQTEALVAIDINSGRSTNEYSVEDTALKTNLEAADEIARQLRLRDLAGLIVVDFIDMEEYRNIRAVEKRFRDALKQDKARIQIGKISGFGLMEMTRQRLRSGVHELLCEPCPHCKGTGYSPADEIAAVRLLRNIERDASLIENASMIKVRASSAITIYLLNKKRESLIALENKFDVKIELLPEPSLYGTDCKVDAVPIEGMTIKYLPAPVQPKYKAEQVTVDTDEEETEETGDDRRRDERRSRGNARRGGRNAEIVDAADTDEISNESDDKNDKSEYHNRKRREFFNRRERKRRTDDVKIYAPEIYVTESGSEVVVENAQTVRSVDEKRSPQSRRDDQNHDRRALDPVAPEEVNGVIIENRRSVASPAVATRLITDEPVLIPEKIETEAVKTPKAEKTPRKTGRSKQVKVKEAEEAEETSLNLIEEPEAVRVYETEPEDHSFIPEIQSEPAPALPELLPETPAAAPEKRLGWWKNRFNL